MYERQARGWTFQPGARAAVLRAASLEKDMARRADVIRRTMEHYRTDNLCICGHWHPEFVADDMARRGELQRINDDHNPLRLAHES